MFDGEMAPFKTRASLLLLVNCSQCITHSLRPLDAPVSHTRTHQPRNETRCFQLGKYISMGPFARSLNILLLHQPRSATQHQNIYQPILFNSPSLANLKPIIKKVYICYFGGAKFKESKFLESSLVHQAWPQDINFSFSSVPQREYRYLTTPVLQK